MNALKPWRQNLSNALHVIKLRWSDSSKFIGSRCRIGKECVLGDHVRVAEGCIFYQTTVGRFSYFAPRSIIVDTEIGKFCSIGQNVSIGLSHHPIDRISTSPYFYDTSLGNRFVNEQKVESYKKTEIGNDVWVGANAMIKSGVKIGNGAVIGAGAYVNKDVDAYSVVIGVPAKHQKYRVSKEIADQIEKTAWWDKPDNEIEKMSPNMLNVNAWLEEFSKK